MYTIETGGCKQHKSSAMTLRRLRRVVERATSVDIKSTLRARGRGARFRSRRCSVQSPGSSSRAPWADSGHGRPLPGWPGSKTPTDRPARNFPRQTVGLRPISARRVNHRTGRTPSSRRPCPKSPETGEWHQSAIFQSQVGAFMTYTL